MFMIYDVISPTGGAPMKVIWRDWSQDALVTVDLDGEKDWPVVHSHADAEEQVKVGLWTLEPGTPPLFTDDRDYLPDRKHILDKRDVDWAVVQPLVADPAIFVKKSRVALIAGAAKLHQVSVGTIKKNLLRVFHGGMAKGALLPRWENIGNKGQERIAKEGAAKRGRPVAEGKLAGVNVTPEIRAIFLIAADEYEKRRKLGLKQAYVESLKMGFMEEVEKLGGGTRHVTLEEYEKAGLPRFEQFLYWVRKDRARIESERKRMGERKWALGRRALLGDSTKEAWGPCSRFQIDATILDVYIRSRRNRRRLVGRATLYVVIDTFSRMIVGFALSLDPPSWLGAMSAIANAVANKKEFCAKYGVQIEEEDWPCHHLPAIFLGDRGEMLSAGVLGLIERFGVVVENTPPYRGDLKGIVESRFRMLQADFRPYAPGYVECDFQERGARDYRLDGALDLDDLTRVIIAGIIDRNNHQEVHGYPRHWGMTEDGVPSVPREMWKWGIANLSGAPRQHDEIDVRFALLPRVQASVHRNGIYHHGNHYTCPKAIAERWFEKARDKRFKVWISYDERDVNVIYVHDKSSPHGFQVGTLTPGSAHRADMNHWELEDLIRIEAVISDLQRNRAAEGAADRVKTVAGICEAAVEAMAAEGDLGSDASQTSNLRDNRAEEREADREEQSADYHGPLRPEPAGQDGGAEIIDLQAARETTPVPGAMPSMRDIRARRNNGNG